MIQKSCGASLYPLTEVQIRAILNTSAIHGCCFKMAAVNLQEELNVRIYSSLLLDNPVLPSISSNFTDISSTVKTRIQEHVD